jgi:hypothetical protein
VAPSPQRPASKSVEAKPRSPMGRRVAIGGIAALVLVGVTIGIISLFTTSGNPPVPGPDGGVGEAKAVPPVQFDQPLQQAILAMPEFRPTGTTGQAGTKAAAGGKLDLAEQTSRSDGSHVLRVWADTQKQGLAGQPVDVRVLMEVRLDAAGKPVQAREIGQKDPDLMAFEKAIDNAKM